MPKIATRIKTQIGGFGGAGLAIDVQLLHEAEFEAVSSRARPRRSSTRLRRLESLDGSEPSRRPSRSTHRHAHDTLRHIGEDEGWPNPEVAAQRFGCHLAARDRPCRARRRDARHSTAQYFRPDPDTLGSAHSLANRSSDSAACPRLVRSAQATRLTTSRDQLGDARPVDDLFVPKQPDRWLVLLVRAGQGRLGVRGRSLRCALVQPGRHAVGHSPVGLPDRGRDLCGIPSAWQRATVPRPGVGGARRRGRGTTRPDLAGAGEAPQAYAW